VFEVTVDRETGHCSNLRLRLKSNLEIWQGSQGAAMINEHDKRVFLCNRLQSLGYAPGHCVRLYGEEFELVAGPRADGSGYGMDAIARKSGSLRHVRIPLSLIQTIERELYVMDRLAFAA
jgi:hypothetical protein